MRLKNINLKLTKLLILSFISVILLVSFACADTEITYEVIDNTITLNETASFELTITNNADEPQTYTLYSFASSQGWTMDPAPLSDKVIEDIGSGDSYTVIINAQPLDELEPGVYSLSLQVDGDIDGVSNVILKSYIFSSEPVSYSPSIDVQVDMDSIIDTQEVSSILVHIENNNALNLSDLELEIQCEVDELSETHGIGIGALESKTLEITFELDAYQQPKEYPIYFVFKNGDDTIEVIEKSFEVETLVSPFDYEMEEETVFFKKFVAFTVSNNGNIENVQTFKYPVSIFNALFISSDSIVIEEDGQKYLAWDMELSPGEDIVVNVDFNYRILVYLVLSLLAFMIFYWIVKSPVDVRKGVITTLGKEGALHELKIALEIRNKSNKTLSNLNVIDMIPGIANLEKSLELGTIKPEQVIPAGKETKLIWSLPELEGKEHRIITYKVKTKLDVLGSFSLPRAIVEHKNKKGKVKKSYSNTFKIDPGKITTV
ncbi:hypothetical protein HN385_04595 [archaeon]|jgi:hypothetical protein|nr:hypothetical protein [archaeon]MBT3450431.1 hypothetical protein [archaeon]MBT6869174.1 hypothetical protein [archaeon]MBT7192821.1 hypothetical protein [archaeon]MBT7381194.1 hypothetical protein [archaeon]